MTMTDDATKEFLNFFIDAKLYNVLNKGFNIVDDIDSIKY